MYSYGYGYTFGLIRNIIGNFTISITGNYLESTTGNYLISKGV